MIVLMSPSQVQFQRMEEEGNAGLPMWFGSPLQPVDFSRSPLLPLAVGSKQPLLVFNVGVLEAVLALCGTRKLCALHQWPNPSTMSLAKRAVYNRLLRSAEVVVSYSEIDVQELRMRYPGKTIHWIGHFVDTNFFSPQRNSDSPEREPYIVCIGDHKRLDKVIAELSQRLEHRIVRITTSRETEAFYESQDSRVICRRNVSFEDLRRYYHHAAVVLNAADDRQIPIGITSFCEAIAMNKPVVTSDRHSCSGYEFEDGEKPYFTVSEIRDTDSWYAAIRKALTAESFKPGKSPRDLSIKLCSFEAMQATWNSVKAMLS